MNKKIIIFILFLALVAGTGFFQFSQKKEVQKKEAIVAALTVNQIIAIDGVKSEKKEAIASGSTALKALYSSHKIVSKGIGENTFITSIDGREASTEKREFWAFYVNGKQAEVGAGTYKVKNNDTIEWKIETY